MVLRNSRPWKPFYWKSRPKTARLSLKNFRPINHIPKATWLDVSDCAMLQTKLFRAQVTESHQINTLAFAVLGNFQ